MWKYFGINLLDQDELFYESWLSMIKQVAEWRKEESAKEGRKRG